MVQSRISKKINYPETHAVDDSDLGYDATQYEIGFPSGLEAMIALGNTRYTYVDDGILYLPVYLVAGGKVASQIGVYEFPAKNYVEFFDAEGDFDISQLADPVPLLYKFATGAYLRGIESGGEGETHGVEGETPGVEGGADEQDEEEESPSKGGLKLPDDDDESPNADYQIARMNEDMEEREKYTERAGGNWLQKFMKNGHYESIDNEGGGDCFFAVVRDAYKNIPKPITVADLRALLSEQASESTYQTFKEQYEMYDREIGSSKQNVRANTADLRDVKAKYLAEPARDGKLAYVNEGKRLLEDRARFKREGEYAREILEDFKFMRNINSLAEFKKAIRTCNFWANIWSLTIMEKVLNLKFIILSQSRYRAGDLANVLLCGNMVDEEIMNRGTFKPKYYIIIEYRRSPVAHYTLVTYRGRRIFRFREIPYGIKQLIVDRCMESEDGLYNLIPKFKALRNKLYPVAVVAAAGEEGQSGEKKEEKGEAKTEEAKAAALEGQAGVTITPTTDSGTEDIGRPREGRYDEGFGDRKNVAFDTNTVFQFYSRSADAPPGEGSGEKIKAEDKLKYTTLAAVGNWRKILSNFHQAEFGLDGHRWQTVEHFYHASKFKNNNPDFYDLFALDSGSELSKKANLAKVAGGRTGITKVKKAGKTQTLRLRPAKVTMDPEFFKSGENARAMYRAQMAKYSQNKPSGEALMATGKAKLQHFVRAHKPVVFYDTMKIREVLGPKK